MALTRRTSLRPHPFFVVLFIVACAVSLEAQHSWRLIGRGMTTPTVRMFAYTADRTLLAATESGVILIDRRTNEAFIRHDAPSSAVFAFPDGVVVSVGDGVYISRSNGSSFELHATTRRSGTIRAGIDGKLYWSDGYLLERSDDTGRTWRRLREVTTGTLDEVHVMRNGDLLAQPERRLSRSTDDGETWTRLSASTSMVSLVETPSGALVGSSWDRVMRSTDRGASWTAGDSLHFTFMTVGHDGSLYGVEAGPDNINRRGVYRSSDDGRTWRRVGPMRPDRLWVDDDGTITWSLGAHLRRSPNTMSSATEVTTEPMIYRGRIAGVAVDPTGVIYATTPSGRRTGWQEYVIDHRLSRSSDDGATWTVAADSLDPVVLAPYRDVVLARRSIVTTYPERDDRTSSGLRISTNGGASWRSVVSSPRDVSWNAAGLMIAASATIYEFEGHALSGAVAVSIDSGRTWRTTLDGEPAFGVLATRGETLIASTLTTGTGFADGSTYRSTDAGVTWETVGDSLALLEIVELPDGALVAAGNETRALGLAGGTPYSPGRFYRSTNDGLDWSIARDSVGLSFHRLGARFAISNSTILVDVDGDLLRSTDAGATWSAVMLAAPTGFVPRQIGLDSTGAFLATAADGIHRSTDDGATWGLVSRAIPDSTITGFVVAPQGYLVAGTTASGLWRTEGVASAAREASADALTVTVAPHPVASSSELRLHLRETAHTRVTLHDLVGRRVRSLHDGPLEAGQRIIAIDAEGLRSGAYLLTVQSGSFQRSTVILLK